MPFPTVLLVGKRFSGKSITSVSIAAAFDIPRWAVWAGTRDTASYWSEHFESSACVKNPDAKGKDYLIKIIRYQQRKGYLYKEVLKQDFPRKYRIGLVFDDVTSKREFRKGEILEDLFSNGRHYHAVIIISAQYPKQLPPAVRLNTDYLFIMHNPKQTLHILWEEFVEEPEEVSVFVDLVRNVTGLKDEQGHDLYCALVYDNVKKTSKLDEIFKIYRNEGMEQIDKILLGDKSWREFMKTHYKDKEYDQEKREYRKQERVKRIQEYRDRQMQRRMAGIDIGASADYFSDESDNEVEDKHANHNSVTLHGKRGSSTQLIMNLKCVIVFLTNSSLRLRP